MSQLKIRCSQLGRIMAKPKKKGEVLSVGAKTYIEELAQASIYQTGVPLDSQGGTKEMKKGKAVEDKAIELVSALLGKKLEKNPEWRENDFICGTCDIFDKKTQTIHDIKSSWSLLTFPALSKQGYDTLYEWQLRGYMMLWSCFRAELNYCLIDTPPELHMESEHLHLVEHLPAHLRMTRVPFIWDAETEYQIIDKCIAAQLYYEETIKEIKDQHERTFEKIPKELRSDVDGYESDGE